ncbi:MAG: MBL fold metallo-hydrolase [Spirochaetales bacterium]|nr:MBL fold metallo-hydrolase [Spirochaetales bacterium]
MNFDTLKAPEGDIKVFFIGHGTLYFENNNQVIHVDPWSQLGDYNQIPKADIILITHDHPDHLDPAVIDQISKNNTVIISPQIVFDKIKKGKVLANGESLTEKGIKIEAVPAYNNSQGREMFHPKGAGNGYILNLAGMRIYIAGDTEDIPEMSRISQIDVAFLPMNQPYTMLPQQLKKAALTIKPKVLYPYHYGETDTSELLEIMKDQPSIEVRIRALQ